MIQHDGMEPARTILIVDDNAEDLLLIKRSFADAGVSNPVQELHCGKSAIAYLGGDGDYSNRVQYPLPSVLLLNLNMPDGGGFAVLNWMSRKMPGRDSLLTIVLCRPNEMKHINRAYALGANSFLIKPGDVHELKNLIHVFHDFWILQHEPH